MTTPPAPRRLLLSACLRAGREGEHRKENDNMSLRISRHPEYGCLEIINDGKAISASTMEEIERHWPVGIEIYAHVTLGYWQGHQRRGQVSYTLVAQMPTTFIPRATILKLWDVTSEETRQLFAAAWAESHR